MMQSIHDIDFSQLYIRHKQRAARPRSEASTWDQKAQQIAVGHLENSYTQAFLSAMDIGKTDTLLDVGCGAGAIAVLAAAKAKHVYALDYSQGMLDKLQANALHYDAHNISTLCKSWEDSWSDVPICDVVVASRSTLVEDMHMALTKLSAQARRHVYITYPATTAFGTDPAIDPAQNPELATPSYLYILAILLQQDIQAQLRFIGSNQCSTGRNSDSRWALIDWAV